MWIKTSNNELIDLDNVDFIYTTSDKQNVFSLIARKYLSADEREEWELCKGPEEHCAEMLELISTRLDVITTLKDAPVKPLQEQASERVINSKKLARHAEFILNEYPADEDSYLTDIDQYWRWIIKADDDDIFEWVNGKGKGLPWDEWRFR